MPATAITRPRKSWRLAGVLVPGIAGDDRLEILLAEEKAKHGSIDKHRDWWEGKLRWTFPAARRGRPFDQ